LAGRLTEQPAPNVVISCAAVIAPVTDRTSEGLLGTGSAIRRGTGCSRNALNRVGSLTQC
jgi:hypothetical protein